MKNKPNWIQWDSEECPDCKQRKAIVRSTNKKEGFVNDGDVVRCGNCGHPGEISIEDSECADVVWCEL